MAIGTALALGAASLGGAALSAKAAKKGAEAQSRSADQATALQREIYNQTTANFAPFLNAGKKGMAAYLYEMGLAGRPTFGGKAPSVETVKNYTGLFGDESGTPTQQKRDRDGNIIGGVTAYKVGDRAFQSLAEAQKWAKNHKEGGRRYEGYTQSPMAKYLMEEGVDSIEGSAAASGGLYSGASMEALESNRARVIGADTSDYFSKLFGLTNMGMAAAGNQAGAGSAYANNVGQLQMQAGQAKAQGYAGAANAWGGALGDVAGIAGYFSNPTQAYAAPTLFAGNSWG